MPIYEYQCTRCKMVIEELRPMAESDKPIEQECQQPEGSRRTQPCQFERILSATPTTFRFNDFTGYAGLDRTRGMDGKVRRKVDKVAKQW